MTFIDILYTIFIGPLQLVFEIIYTIANRFIGHPGLAIVILSLIMNFLVLPLYKRSDAMQEAARDVEQKLSKGVTHIKKTFSGDEQMMMLQTYYTLNNYKPTDALNGSVSLLLEIPFFMAAYNFLSSLQLIQGVSLGPIADLGAPDAMLTIGGFTVNLLPILMTLVNVISSAIYLKGFPLKTKIQLYGMAFFFLIFLYTSPAGLVFYWTLNNVFSLVKTLFYKLKNPKKVLTILASVVGIVVLALNAFVYEAASPKRELFIICLSIALQLPLIASLFGKKIKFSKKEQLVQNDTKMFIVGGLFLAVLVGLLIPSTLIAASPQEFVDVTYFYNPLWYIAKTFCLAFGTFMVWFGVFYWISSPAGKVLFDKLVWILCGVMLVNYMFFGTDLGIISANLQYENGMDFNMNQQLINALILLGVAGVMYFVVYKWKKTVASVLLIGCIALAAMSGMHVMTINGAISEVEDIIAQTNESTPHFELSKTGKNVVVIMIDRGLGAQLPYILNEKPELKEQFAGFTYYSNTISHGGFTNFGAPGLFGGYEYTPVEMNKRDSETLVSKHNEALKVMPVVFAENGYDVTVMDVPYANYQWIPDMSIYDEYPEISTYIAKGKFGDTKSREYNIQNNLRNFFCFSVMKTMPLLMQETLYENGNYNKTSVEETLVYSTQQIQNLTVADGIYSTFMEAYNVLENMSTITQITDKENNNFVMMLNDATHDPMMLQEPNYTPAQHVDNTAYYNDVVNRFTLDGKVLKMETSSQVIHYQANMAALIQLGKWMEWLKQNDVYDNTRIILVSDHGRPLRQVENLILGDSSEQKYDASFYYPLLLVKDFDSKEFSVSDEFMTNADTPVLAFKDIIDNPVNPFTGKTIDNNEKYLHEQYIITSSKCDVATNNGNEYLPDTWWAVKDNIWEKENWRYIDEVVTRPDLVEE